MASENAGENAEHANAAKINGLHDGDSTPSGHDNGQIAGANDSTTIGDPSSSPAVTEPEPRRWFTQRWFKSGKKGSSAASAPPPPTQPTRPLNLNDPKVREFADDDEVRRYYQQRIMAAVAEGTAHEGANMAGTGTANSRASGVDTGTEGRESGMEVRPRNNNYFKSRRIQKGTTERPWLTEKDPRDKWNTIIPLVGLFIGMGVCGFLIWDGFRSVNHNKYCPVFEDDFSSGFNNKKWMKEVEVGGFGNGEFQQTTDTAENVFIKDGILHIKPTLQDEALVEKNHIIDLRGHGCTGRNWEDCVTSTNTTNGTIVNPVKSARINTKLSASIKFGRVEIIAKLPAGDWLWPSIWMLPTDQKYGEWPRSGEIDITESRGNNWTYGQGGNNLVSSALHFGPNPGHDGWWRNNVKRRALHTSYSADFNTFGVEWSEKYIFTYVNTRLLQVLYTHFSEPFWTYGRFPLADKNGTRLDNPWSRTGSNTSPFDQQFYLILDVAVGGTDGWFEDGKSGKP